MLEPLHSAQPSAMLQPSAQPRRRSICGTWHASAELSPPCMLAQKPCTASSPSPPRRLPCSCVPTTAPCPSPRSSVTGSSRGLGRHPGDSAARRRYHDAVTLPNYHQSMSISPGDARHGPPTARATGARHARDIARPRPPAPPALRLQGTVSIVRCTVVRYSKVE